MRPLAKPLSAAYGHARLRVLTDLVTPPNHKIRFAQLQSRLPVTDTALRSRLHSFQFAAGTGEFLRAASRRCCHLRYGSTGNNSIFIYGCGAFSKVLPCCRLASTRVRRSRIDGLMCQDRRARVPAAHSPGLFVSCKHNQCGRIDASVRGLPHLRRGAWRALTIFLVSLQPPLHACEGSPRDPLC